MNLFQKVFGTRSEHEVKRIMPLVEKTESLRPEMQKLTDEQLRDKTREFKKRLSEGETLDDLLPEAFAVVREGAKRVLGMEHYLSLIHIFSLMRGSMNLYTISTTTFAVMTRNARKMVVPMIMV